jgi:hypothetical protein
VPHAVALDVRRRQDGERCYLCAKAFSLFQRRHTCRVCCGSVCHDCGSHFLAVPPALIRDATARAEVERRPATAVRLCEDCFYQLK